MIFQRFLSILLFSALVCVALHERPAIAQDQNESQTNPQHKLGDAEITKNLKDEPEFNAPRNGRIQLRALPGALPANAHLLDLQVPKDSEINVGVEKK